MPNVLGSEIDKLIRLRQKRMAAQKKADEIKKEESLLTESLIEICAKQKIEKASGKLGTFSIKMAPFPVVKDWNEFYAYVRKQDAFELLQKRVGVGAWRERVEAGKVPSGTEVSEIWTSTLTAKR